MTILSFRQGALLAALLLTLGTSSLCAQRFTNPMIAHGADPSVVAVDGIYYSVQSSCSTLHAAGICIRSASNLPELGAAKPSVVWTPAPNARNALEIWAPQIRHFATGYPGGQWFIYFAADAKGDNEHRLFALTPANPKQPLGRWIVADTGAPDGGLVTDWKSAWAIDPDVYEGSDHALYLIYSCRQDNTNRNPGRYQSICLAGMRDPLHLKADPTTGKEVVELSYPNQRWETRGFPTEEGPFGFTRDGVDYIFFSGSFSGAPDMYTEGVLVNRHPPQAGGRNPLTDPAAWVKDGPIFDGHHFAYGTASSVLVPSPDDTEIWQVYHGTDCRTNCTKGANGLTWRDRSDRAQRGAWSADGDLVLGYPVDVVDHDDGTGEPVPLLPPSRNHNGSTVQLQWGDAFGDAAEDNAQQGLQIGAWAVSKATLSNSDLTPSRIDQAFYGANPNWEDYVVYTRAQLTEAGQGQTPASFGVYGAYVDHANWFAATIDVSSCGVPGCVRTEASTQGVAQPSLACPLPNDFDSKAANILAVEAINGTYSVLINGVALLGPCQNRTFNLTIFADLQAALAHGVNGQAGVRVVNARARFTDFDVSPGVPGAGSPLQVYAFSDPESHLTLDVCSRDCRSVPVGSLVERPPDASYPDLHSQTQSWTLLDRTNGAFAMRNQASGLCLEDLSGTTPTSVGSQQRPCTGTAGQRWQFVPAGEGSRFLIENQASSRVLEPAGAAPEMRLKESPLNRGWRLVVQ